MDSIDGFYRGYFTGAQGNGFALLVFQSGKLAGADALGVTFDGTYVRNEAGGGYIGHVVVAAPPNGTLVQGVTTGPNGMSYEVTLQIPANFLDMPFFRLQTPLGPVNVKVERIRSID